MWCSGFVETWPKSGGSDCTAEIIPTYTTVTALSHNCSLNSLFDGFAFTVLDLPIILVLCNRLFFLTICDHWFLVFDSFSLWLNETISLCLHLKKPVCWTRIYFRYKSTTQQADTGYDCCFYFSQGVRDVSACLLLATWQQGRILNAGDDRGVCRRHDHRGLLGPLVFQADVKICFCWGVNTNVWKA